MTSMKGDLSRVALISDIHGNCVALDAVLTNIHPERVDRIVCLGDVAEVGPQPREVIARLREIGCPVVMGNTDEELLTGHFEELGNDGDDDSGKIRDLSVWGAEQLTASDHEFLRSFQPTVEVTFDGGTKLLCYHGSPRSNTEPVEAMMTGEQLEPIFSGRDAMIFAGGHTHTQMLRRYRDKLILNPGSVGLPFEIRGDGSYRNPPWAEYAIVTSKGSELSVNMRRAPVDIEAIADAARTSGMPHAEWYIKDWQAK